MNTYEKNYWSVYLDFLDDFKELEYKGYPIAYLCHYGSLVRDNPLLNEKLNSPKYTESLKNKVKDASEVQARFNDMKSSLQKSRKKKKGGKAVFHDVYDLLRFPNDTFYKYFDKNQTLILQDKISQRKKKQYLTNLKGYQIQNFVQYGKDVRVTINSFKKSAKNILSKMPNHIVYSDQTFKQRFLIQIAKIVNRIEEVGGLFKKVSVSTVIVPSTHYPESRTLVLVAAAYGIPTICMQHGIISSEFGYLPKIADIDAVYGPFEVDWYKGKGVDMKGLEIIGHPRFDNISHPPKFGKEALIKKLGIDPKKKNILLIVRGQIQFREWKEFLDYLSVKNEVNVIVKDFKFKKKHPLFNIQSFVFSSKGVDLYDLLHLSDIVVSYSSTVALEAMLAKKPVFILNKPFAGYTGYCEHMGSLVQSDPKKLAGLLSSFLKDKQVMEYTNKTVREFLTNAYSTKLSSGQRLANLIKKLSQ